MNFLKVLFRELNLENIVIFKLGAFGTLFILYSINSFELKIPIKFAELFNVICLSCSTYTDGNTKK